jgi:hypothetical protein
MTEEGIQEIAAAARVDVATARRVLAAFEKSPRRKNRDAAIAARAMSAVMEAFASDLAQAARRLSSEISNMDEDAIERFVNEQDPPGPQS